MKTPFPWRSALVATALYTAAFLLTTTLHELGHAVVSKLLGGQPVLYNTHVESRAEPLPSGTELAIALAGPFSSLGQGLLVLALRWRSRATGNAALFWLYAGLFGLINFLGYLLTGPFVSYGDIGRAEVLAHVLLWGSVALALAAAVGVHKSIAATAPLFLRFGPGRARQPRGRLMRALIAVPWLLGSVLITALSWPLPALLSLIYPPMSSMVLGAAWGAAMQQPYPSAEENQPPLLTTLRLWPALALLLAVAVGYRLLAPGVAL